MDDADMIQGDASCRYADAVDGVKNFKVPGPAVRYPADGQCPVMTNQ